MLCRWRISLASVPGERLNEFHDASGLITVSVFFAKSQNEQEHFTDFGVNVDPDMVCIGGGGDATDNSPGALLTASYPNDDLTGWLVSSKDHKYPMKYPLYGYAIGIKIKGMSSEQLIEYISVNVANSGVANHPEVSVSPPDNRYLLINGGFKVEWHGFGNLATASFPESITSWKARSKDHLEADPANLKVYGISIKQELPVGQIGTRIFKKTSGVSNHPFEFAYVDAPFALCGGGGEVHYTGFGNMLWALHPTTNKDEQFFSARSKDHGETDQSTITAYAMGILLSQKSGTINQG